MVKNTLSKFNVFAAVRGFKYLCATQIYKLNIVSKQK